MSDRPSASVSDQIADACRREMATEHLLFRTIRFVAQHQPDLLDDLDRSLDHLRDKAQDEDKDDGAVRDIARRFNQEPACRAIK